MQCLPVTGTWTFSYIHIIQISTGHAWCLIDLDFVQYEEPTEDVQGLREKIELERSELAPWLRESAVKLGEASTAMNGHAGEQLPISLALSAEQLSRAQKQLRIPKQQVTPASSTQKEIR